jgi:hypothetical protein
LAIVNETSRAATIVTNEDNCQFLKVQKPYYDKIMRNAEANTVRLTEHGNEVLVLQKMPSKCLDESRPPSKTPIIASKPNFKYMVMAGTPDKIVEYLLETRIDLSLSPELLLDNQSTSKNAELLMSNGGLLYNVFDSTLSSSDTFLEDFLLTYQIYLSNFTLCKYLLKYYKIDQMPGARSLMSSSSLASTSGCTAIVGSSTGVSMSSTDSGIECALSHKRKTMRFTCAWLQVAKDPFFLDPHIAAFLDELQQLSQAELKTYGDQLEEERRMLTNILDCKSAYEQEMANRGVKKWKSDTSGPIRRLSIRGVTCNLINSKLSSSVQTNSSSTGLSSLFSNSSILSSAANESNLSGGSGGATPTGPANVSSSSANPTGSLSKGGGLFSSITGINSRHNSLANLASVIATPTSGLKDSGSSNAVTPESEFFMINRRLNVIRAKDEMISRVYCADHTYTTLKLPVDSTAQTIKMQAADKLNLTRAQLNRSQAELDKADSSTGIGSDQPASKSSKALENEGELVLVEMKSTGERIPFKDSEVSIQTGLSVNGRIFVSLIDHLDALTPLSEQMGPTVSTSLQLEQFGSQELAYYLTFYSWSLFQNVHEVNGALARPNSVHVLTRPFRLHSTSSSIRCLVVTTSLRLPPI